MTRTQTRDTLDTQADLIIGADGAYSLIRRLMAKRPRYDCNQTYIDHGYVELSYPTTKEGKV